MNFSIFDLYGSELGRNATLHYPYTYPQPPHHSHISSPDSITWEDTEEIPRKPPFKITPTEVETPLNFPQQSHKFVPECYLETDSKPSTPVLVKEPGPVCKWPHDLRLVRSLVTLKPALSKLATRKEPRRRLAVGWTNSAQLSSSVTYSHHTLPQLQQKPGVRNDLPRLRTNAGLRVKTKQLGRSFSHEVEVEKKRSVVPSAARKHYIRQTL